VLTKKVKRNKGAGGVDKMQVESLKDYLVENKDWHSAKSFILTTTIITDRLRQVGYIFLSDYYQKVNLVN
jgi:hypothetical protein